MSRATASTARGSPTPTWCRSAARCSTACSAIRPTSSASCARTCSVTAADLLAISKTPGAITEAGLRNNISVGLQYLANWLGGNGAVAIFNLMEDAATAEISRSQVWQWLHNDVSLADGPKVTRELVRADHRRGAGHDPRSSRATPSTRARYDEAVALFTAVALADDYAEFLTIPAYERDALTRRPDP